MGQQAIFGAGVLWARQLTDATGAAIANPTPVKFGAVQDISLDISWDTKLLYGSSQFAVLAGRGKGKVSGKAKAAYVNGALLNSIVFGQNATYSSTTEYADVNDTSTGILIPSTPFTLTGAASLTATTFLIPSSGTFVKDLGVRNAATGNQFTRVASAPAAGQYSVNEATGAYLFSSADNVSAIKVQIDYQYSFATTTGNSLTVMNLQMGYAPTFGMDINVDYNGQKGSISLPLCIASKLTIATKLDDFAIPEFDFDAFADASGRVIIPSWAN